MHSENMDHDYSELRDIKIVKKNNRGTPLGGVISPLLSILVVKSILITLDRGGIWIVA